MTTSNELVPMILPTVMIPLTLVSVGLSVVATFIAALFGIQLKLEGPKKLLEVLLKPKVLASAFALNALIFGGMHGWKWWANYPRLISTIESETKERAQKSDLNYADVPTVPFLFTSSKSQADVPEGLEQVWRIHTGKGSFRAAVVTNERVFFGNDYGIVRELELTTGKEIRSFYIGTAASSELTLWNNSIYIGEGVHDTHHARIYRFDLKSGNFQGSYQTLGHTEAQAVVGSYEGENTLFAVGGVDGLHAVDPVTMQGKWKVNLGHMDAGILVDEGFVFIGTGREKDDDKKNKCFAAALDFKTGKILWQRELAASSWMRPVVIGENVCYVAGEIYFPTERGHISCFDRKSGAHTIAMNTTDPLAGTPKILDNSILYTSIHGLVCRFDLESKRNLWCFDAKLKDSKSLAGASYDPRGHVVVYPSMTNGLYVLDPNDGKVLMHWNPTKEQGEWKKTYADVTVAGDYWIVSDDDGSVRALRAKFVPKTAQQ
jgi:outer membrane protein assembly factor BamB